MGSATPPLLYFCKDEKYRGFRVKIRFIKSQTCSLSVICNGVRGEL